MNQLMRNVTPDFVKSKAPKEAREDYLSKANF